MPAAAAATATTTTTAKTSPDAHGEKDNYNDGDDRVGGPVIIGLDRCASFRERVSQSPQKIGFWEWREILIPERPNSGFPYRQIVGSSSMIMINMQIKIILIPAIITIIIIIIMVVVVVATATEEEVSS